jgi:hypothetical protein
MCREQNMKQGKLDFGYPAVDKVEPKEPKEARIITTHEATGGDGGGGRKPGGELLERMLGTENMFLTCERVVRNGGAAGVDGISSCLRSI